jgi:glycine cleavage system H protein
LDLNKLKYSPELVWVRLDDEHQATIGLTEEALRDYTELTKIRLPSEGEDFTKDEVLGHLFAGRGRGFKIIAPMSGEILAVNEDLMDAPEAILEDPYEEGWLVRQSVTVISEVEDLMTRYEYEDFVEEELLDEDDEDAFGDDDEYDDSDDGYDEDEDEEDYYEIDDDDEY